MSVFLLIHITGTLAFNINLLDSSKSSSPSPSSSHPSSSSSSSSSSPSSSSSSETCCIDLKLEEQLRVECRNENARLLSERKLYNSEAELRWRKHFRAEIEIGADREAEVRERAEDSELQRKLAEISCARKIKDLEDELKKKKMELEMKEKVHDTLFTYCCPNVK